MPGRKNELDTDTMKPPSPWIPMSDPVDVKHLGKLCEELNECGAAASRGLIQGIDEPEPTTGKINRAWLAEEIADVLANVELVTERFNLPLHAIIARKERKKANLRIWHAVAAVDYSEAEVDVIVAGYLPEHVMAG